jgi:hypothetical protein
MQIVIELTAHYDWEPMDGQASQADIMALRAKPSQDGKWLKKVTKNILTHTAINLQEAEIENCMKHFARIGLPKTRARTIAWYLEEKVMPHHAASEHWTKISVHDEPAIETFLNKHFDLNEKVIESDVKTGE